MFLVAAQIEQRQTRRESLADLQSKAAAAARLALIGDGWTPADRDDCAAHLVAKILETVPTVAKRGTPAEVLRYIGTVEAAPVEDAPRIRRLLVPGAAWTPDTVPMAHATFSRLALEAANYRRSVEAARRRDTAHAEAQEAGAPAEMDAPHVEADTLSDLWEHDPSRAAHETARRMLSDLGLARLGRAYPAALEAALLAHGWTPGEAAAAMGYSPDTLRQVRRRAVARIPSATVHTLAAHAEALSYPDTAQEHPHVADIGQRATGWRESVEEAAPVTVRRTGSALEAKRVRASAAAAAVATVPQPEPEKTATVR
jgi:hypothetical protein